MMKLRFDERERYTDTSDFTAYIFEPPRLFLSVRLFVGKDFDWNVRLFTCIFPFRVAPKSYFVLIRFHTLAYTIKHSRRISVAQRLVDSRGQLLHFDRWKGLTPWIAHLSSPPTVFLSILIILLENHLRSDLYVRSIPEPPSSPLPLSTTEETMCTRYTLCKLTTNLNDDHSDLTFAIQGQCADGEIIVFLVLWCSVFCNAEG